MQITSRFTIGVHMLVAIDYFMGKEVITSRFLSMSVGANPVIVRTVLSSLGEAGLVSVRQGKSGIDLARPLSEISFYDVYTALNCANEDGFFHFHSHPNENCPVGRNVHYALDERLGNLQRKMEEEMKSIKLSDVAADVRSAARNQKSKGEES